jgi:excinuclease ABC subunit C
MKPEEFLKISITIPNNPGIYKYFDAGNVLLYVGKAKNLRKRIGSYFTKTLTDYKTYELIQRIHRIDFAIVNSEQDAFLLENSLIKQFQPRFNINLKDDKSYPYIVIKNEPFPRVFLTRRKIEDGSEYLGPFTSVGKVRELLNFVRQYIQLRTCKLNLTEQNIRKRKFKVCLEYHLGNCKGPCEALQNGEDYAENLVQVKNFLKGNLFPVIQHHKAEMKEYAAKLQFEKAEIIRKKIDHLQQYQARSAIVNDKLGDLDVFSISSEADLAFVNFLMVRNGNIVDTQTITLEKKLDEAPQELLSFGIRSLRETFNSKAYEIIIPFEMNYPEEGISITVPKAGDKKKLLELSEKNVKYFVEEMNRRKRLHLEERDNDKTETLLQLQEDLKLQDLPVHIECFDNSNFQGSFPVSAMVCFKDGLPSKKDYRHYNIKTVSGIDDFATMKEVVYRRYRRLLSENQPLPQLVIIDGGKGQLGAALASIEELGLIGRMTVVGLAKNEEEIFFAGDKESLRLPYDSPALKLIRYIRDEVHRFGISFHRQKRSKGSFSNEIEEIKGVGRNTADNLLKIYKSIKNIAAANENELASHIGKSKAKIIWNYFHNSQDNANGSNPYI